MAGPSIEPIDSSAGSNVKSLVDLFTEAFHSHPFTLELGLAEKASVRRLMDGLVELYTTGFEDTMVHGVRLGSELVCASVSMPSDSRASPSSLLRFALLSARLMGLRSFWKLANAFYLTVPKYRGRHLYVALLATHPAHQRRGLGTAMLRFLFERAVELGFEGVALSTVKGLPAYRLYLREGFRVDKEVPMGRLTVCHMSRPAGQPT